MIQFSSVVHAASDAKRLDLSVELQRHVLAGDIVTMNGQREIIPNGRLCLEGTVIKAILRPGEALPPEFESAPLVETQGSIYPGLFDLHNHLPYNIIPLWQVDRKFRNRLEWQGIREYYPAVRAPFSLLNNHADVDYRRAIVRFTECRNLLGGVTTGHGMGFTKDVTYDGLMRNVEEPHAPELPKAQSRTPDLDAEGLNKLLEWTGQQRPFIYHLSEGLDERARDCVKYLQQNPEALNPYLVCIHCVGVQAPDFDSLKAVAGIVWSPTSNFLLYGETCKVDEAKKRGIPIAIGADWAPSGCKNLLGELKVARAASRQMGGVLSDEDIVAAVTCVPAKMIGWDKTLGSLSPGKWADLLILEGTGGDHYARLVEARETSIRAVIIGGRIRLGEAQGFTMGQPLSSENISMGGKGYVLDLAEPGTDGVGGMKLSEAFEKIRHGLEHLPDFESDQKARTFAGDGDAGNQWRFEDDMHAVSFSSLLRKADQLPAVPMRLAPLTAVDDPDFNRAMRESVNMPAYAKQVFTD